MFTRSSFGTGKTNNAEAGFILIAKPLWQEPIYQRSVILIVERGSETSRGVIINKFSNLDVVQALPDLGTSLLLQYGGPFNKNLIFFLHDQPQIPDCIDMDNGFFIGGDYDALKDMVVRKKVNAEKIRFCAGSVKWSAGQLEKELEEEKWWVSRITAKEYLSLDPE